MSEQKFHNEIFIPEEQSQPELNVSKWKAFVRLLIFIFCVCGLCTTFQYTPKNNDINEKSYGVKGLEDIHTLVKEDSLTGKGNVLNHNRKCEHFQEMSCGLKEVLANVQTLMKEYSLTPKESVLCPKCKAKHNVWYSKVHKTGSNTNSVILYRYAWRHNLTVVPLTGPIPHDAKDIKGYLTLIGKDKNRLFNITADHMPFHKEFLENLMPPDVTYIASLRHPLAQIKANFVELNLKKRLDIKAKDPVRAFLEDSEVFSRGAKIVRGMTMLTDLGMSPLSQDNVTEIEKYINYIEKTFHVILITEYFLESLVMMKRTLCWTTSDIVFIMRRVRNYEYKYSVYNQDLEDKHKAFTPGDYALYQHFLNLFLIKLSLQPSDFWDELYQFKNIMHSVTGFCDDVASKLQKDKKIIYNMARQRQHILVHSVTVSAVDCAVMKIFYKILRNVLRVRQNPSLCLAPNLKDSDTHMHEIFWKNKTEGSVILNEAYCSTWDDYYRFPLSILARPDAYVFDL